MTFKRRTWEAISETMSSKTVRTPDGCFVWTGAVDSDGYPKIAVGVRDGVAVTANAARVAYRLSKGKYPPGHLERTCGNRRCVAIAHLQNRKRGRSGGLALARSKGPPPATWEKCGHPHTRKNTLDHMCRICRLEYLREYNRTRRPGRGVLK